MANHRHKRGSDLRIRSASKAAAADKLLYAAQIERETYDHLTLERRTLPKWRMKTRRKNDRLRRLALLRFMQAITAAQDVAKKDRYVEL